MAEIAFAFLGAVFGLILGLGVDYFREPKLIVTLEGIEPLVMENRTKILRVNAVNQPLPRWAQRFLSRRLASFCRGDIRFCKVDGQPFFSDRTMPARFTGSREPVNVGIYTYENHPQGKLWGFIQDEYQRRMPSTIDLIAGDPMGIDVVMRDIQDDGSCYGFTNESYNHLHKKHPDWRLPTGTYLIRVRLYTQGHLSCTRDFRLLNESTSLQDFKLILATWQDSRKIDQHLIIYN